MTEAVGLIPRLCAEPRPAHVPGRDEARAIAQFLDNQRRGLYPQAPVPCLCGRHDDQLVATFDRYGLPVRTVICRACGLMRSDPYLTPEAQTHFYTHLYRGLYSISGPQALFAHQREYGQVLCRWLAKHQLGSPRRVFEIGCGAGGILQTFADQGSKVFGCDFDQAYLAHGRAQGLTLEQGDALSLTQHGQADLLIYSHVLEHLRDPVAELHRARSLLAERGRVLVAVPGVLAIRQTYRSLHRYLQNAHVWHFCLRSMDMVMAAAGLVRVAGDETVHAVYQAGSDPAAAKHDGNLAGTISRSLRRTEALRHVPARTQVLAGTLKVAQRLLGLRLYHGVRRLLTGG